MNFVLFHRLPIFDRFLITALDDRRYGHLLRWVDRETGQFAIQWSRKGSGQNVDSFRVFHDWDRLKGRSNESDLRLSKMRFAAVLRKALEIGAIEKVASAGEGEKRFKLCSREQFYHMRRWNLCYTQREREAAMALMELGRE